MGWLFRLHVHGRLLRRDRHLGQRHVHCRFSLEPGNLLRSRELRTRLHELHTSSWRLRLHLRESWRCLWLLHDHRNWLRGRLCRRRIPSATPSAVAAPVNGSGHPGSGASASSPAFTAPVPFAATAVSKPAFATARV